MKRSLLTTLPVYFDRYINLTDDVDVHQALNISLKELEQLHLDDYETIGDKVYAPGKWTIKDIWQHTIDTERVFTYRATAFARNQDVVTGYDENQYAANAGAFRRTLPDLWQEAIALRKATICLFRSFSAEQLDRSGMGFKGLYTVRDIGFIIAGHQRWHENVIRERYVML